MPTLVETAKSLVQEARQREKCLALATQVDRRLEDLNDASKTGNGSVAAGGLLILGGLAVGIFVNPFAGFAMAVGGAVGVANGLDAKAAALKKATKELQRAVDDLQQCLRS